MLEVGVGLAVGHRPPASGARTGGVDSSITEAGRPSSFDAVRRLLEPLGVVALDVVGARREVVERMAVGGEHDRGRSPRAATLVERVEELRQRVGASASMPADVRRDRRQHVVAGQQRCRRSGRTGRGGRRCGPACARPPSRGGRGVIVSASSRRTVGPRMLSMRRNPRRDARLARRRRAVVAAPRRRAARARARSSSSSLPTTGSSEVDGRRARPGPTSMRKARWVTRSAPVLARTAGPRRRSGRGGSG